MQTSLYREADRRSGCCRTGTLPRRYSLRQHVAAQAPCERRGAVLRREFREHVAGACHAHGLPADEAVVGQVAQQHHLADAVGTQQDDAEAVVYEAETKQLFDRLPVDTFRPASVEVRDGLEGANARGAQAPVEAAALSLSLFGPEQLVHPWLVADLVEAREQAKQAETAQALLCG